MDPRKANLIRRAHLSGQLLKLSAEFALNWDKGHRRAEGWIDGGAEI
jgi:hypothetical protein